MIIELLRPDHFRTFEPQPAQRDTWLANRDFYLSGAELDGYAFVADERLLGAIGWFPRTEYIAVMWALFSTNLHMHATHMLRFSNMLCDALLSGTVHRIETNVEVGFAQGERTMQLMGFEKEGVMKAFGANGGDHYLYAKVRYG